MGRKPTRLPAGVEQALDAALDKTLAIQRPVVLAYLDRIRGRSPGATPAELLTKLERHYLAAVAGIGGASGAAAAVPGAGTGVALATGAAEIAAFVSATGMYVLAVAEVHGVPVHDPHVRRALVVAVLVGEGAAASVEAAGVQASHWAQVLARTGSRGKVAGVNSRLARLLVTRFGARQGALLVGRALPLGLGAGIGVAGNVALARTAITAARRAFGPPPKRLAPRVVEG